MEHDQARAAVLQQLERRGVGGAGGVAILDAETIKKDYGWIFFYNSQRYVETGDIFQALVGHGPVVVVAATGTVIELGSSLPPEDAIRLAEKEFKLG